MASWKLVVENYGKIKSAEIEIAPLTFFVGDNNSGKSYLLELLWGIEKFGVSGLIGDNYVNTDEINFLSDWICTQINIAVEKKQHEVSLGAVADILEKILNIELRKNRNKLVRKIFNSATVEIGNMYIKLRDVPKDILYIAYNENTEILRASVNKSGGFGFGKGIVEDKEYETDPMIRWFTIRGIYSAILNIYMSEDREDSSIYLPAARTGFMLTKDIINKTGRKNTFNLSEEKEEITPFLRPINQFLDIMGDMSAELVQDKDNLRLAGELEREMTNGVVEISAMPNKEVQYTPEGYRKGIPLRLSSAVVTELSPLILILKHKRIINRLYYEEPEMCLHPQLQYKMGKMLGRMANAGIGVVVTTHSDIILQHINNMIKLSKREDKKEICEKYDYMQQDLLSYRQIKVYQLKAKPRGKTEVMELLCGENGFCVPTFNDVLSDIMDESYEIQG